MGDFDKYMFYLKKQCDELITLGEKYIKIYSEESKTNYILQRGVLQGYIQCLYDNDFIDYDEWQSMNDFASETVKRALDVKA